MSLVCCVQYHHIQLNLVVMLEIIAFTLLCVCVMIALRVLPAEYTTSYYARKLNEIPGPKGLPLIGCVFKYYLPAEKILETVGDIFKEYGSFVRVWLLGFAYVGIASPEESEVLLNNVKNLDKGNDYNYLRPWLGNGLVTSTGAKWQLHRKILTPAFHFKILEQFVDVLNDQSEILVRQLSQNVHKDWINMNSFIDLCALDIICETTMGTSVNAQTGGKVEYVAAVKRMSELLHERMLDFWLWHDWTFKFSKFGREQARVLDILHTFTDKVIRERKAEYRALGPVAQTEETFTRKRRLAFLDLLIEVAEKEGLLSDRDIREEVDTFMFEGHDTVSAAMSWSMWLLGLHPDIQEKAVEELRDIFGDSDRAATYNDLQNMKYLEQVIKEALRLYPSVPAFSRKLSVDIQCGKYTVPAATNIGIAVYYLHRNKKHFPNPEKFDPERFSPENCLGRHPYAYLPFSAGPRNCIGQRFAIMEEKAVISAVLRKFQLTSLDKPKDVLGMGQLVLRPKHGLRIKLAPRNVGGRR